LRTGRGLELRRIRIFLKAAKYRLQGGLFIVSATGQTYYKRFKTDISRRFVMPVKKAIVFLADGFEEIEAVTPVDFIRRAGVEVTTVSISASKAVTSSRKITLIADRLITEIPGGAEYDALILPGGLPGAANLAASTEAGGLLKNQAASGRLVAAICAAPALVLSPLGLLNGKRCTCYPGMEKDAQATGAVWLEDRVVIDGNIITSRGAGTAAEWSLAVIEALLGRAESDKVAKAVVMRT
jgi:4-methyl-5(b-hydroxyethyl)-thiazole monophosphate biosynthesis